MNTRPHRPPPPPPRRPVGGAAAAARVEQQLLEAEHLAGLGSFDWFPASGELHWSDQHFRLWGLAPGSVQPSLQAFRQGIHPDDLARVDQQLAAALAGGPRYDCRHRVRWEDGTVRHIHGRGEVLFDPQGQPLRMIGAVLDVTSQVEHEQALDLYRFVLDALGDPVSVLDRQLSYRLVNAAWSEANGTPPGQALGRRFDVVFPVVVSPARRQAAAACAAGAQPAPVRARSPSPLHPDRLLETRYFPLTHPALDGPGAVMISRDVSVEQRALEALEAGLDNLRLTINTIDQGIFASDATGPDQPVLFVNEQLLAMWRIPPERAQPLTPATIIEFARRLFVDPDRETQQIDAIVRGNLDCEDRVELRDGRILARRCRPRRVDGRAVRVWAFRDITQEVQAERALRDARDSAERASQAKSRFLSQLSHELRTPLNAVLGYANLLAMGGSSALGARALQQVEQIRIGGRHLLTLINDLLDLARIEAGQVGIRLADVALQPLFDECLKLVAPQAQQQRVRLDPPDAGPLFVRADPTRLQQVLLNLLSNAIKYNRAGGLVRLLARPQGALLRVEVHDQGQGITEADRGRLFQAFERLDADSSGTLGTGIGLALSRELVGRMGGEIGVDSVPGQGSCFWVVLPAPASG
jgi:signal transduction histidine kinase